MKISCTTQQGYQTACLFQQLVERVAFATLIVITVIPISQNTDKPLATAMADSQPEATPQTMPPSQASPEIQHDIEAETTRVRKRTTHWHTDMTVAFLEFLRKSRNEGQLVSDKATEIKPVMQVILPRLIAKFPTPG